MVGMEQRSVPDGIVNGYDDTATLIPREPTLQRGQTHGAAVTGTYAFISKLSSQLWDRQICLTRSGEGFLAQGQRSSIPLRIFHLTPL